MEIVVLWIGAVVLVPFFWLLGEGRKKLGSWNLSEHDQRDFFTGFFGIIILNALLYPLSLVLRGDSTLPETRAAISLALPWVVNLALLIFFAFYRRWIAQGALALIGFLLVWVILAGVFFLVSCFVIIIIGGILDSCLGGH